MKIRFKHPTDGSYDQGQVYDFEVGIASLYLSRGVAELPRRAAIRLQLDMNDTPDIAARSKIQRELDTLLPELTEAERQEFFRIRSLLAGKGKFEDKRENRMMKTQSVSKK